MFSRTGWWYVKRLCLVVLCSCMLSYAQRNEAAVLTEGDAYFGNEIFVATQTGNGSLSITSPTVLQGGGIFVGGQPGFDGDVIVDGGTYESTGNVMSIGIQGEGSLEILNGGVVTTRDLAGTDLVVAEQSGSIGSVLVSGEGSLLDMPVGDATIGANGYGEFTIEQGAKAIHERGNVGSNGFFGGNGFGIGVATVRDSGSRWDVIGPLTVGDDGNSGELWIQNGGRVFSNSTQDYEAIIGSDNASGLVVVDGPGSLWQQLGNQSIEVGSTGAGTVSVSNGGKVTSPGLIVGGSNGGSANPFPNGLVTIDGFGSQWITESLEVGVQGIGQLHITNGAKLIQSNPEFGAVLGRNEGSYGRVVVDGIGSQWIYSAYNFDLGMHGTGELHIKNGAVVQHNNVEIGRESRGLGSGIIRIDGPGSTWIVGNIDLEDDSKGVVEVNDGGILKFNVPNGFAPELDITLSNGTIIQNGHPLRASLRNLSTIRGHGSIHAHVENDGIIYVGEGEHLIFHEGILNGTNTGRRGRVDIVGGELEVHDSFINRGGSIILSNSILRVADQFSPTTIELQPGSELLVAAGQNHIYGDLQSDNSDIILSGNSQTTFYDDVRNAGNFNVATGSVVTIFGDFSGNGIGGGGTAFLEGNVSPGFSPGVMQFGGELNLGDFSQLNIEIEGAAPGTQHDLIGVLGQATIGGDLLLDATAPLGDATLTILQADSIVGAFDSVPLFSHIGSGMFLTDIQYTDTEVMISVAEGFADFDLNGFVDNADLATLQANYGLSSGATLAQGDANGDGVVNGQDFMIWQSRFELPEFSTSGQVVPEPASVVLLLASVVCLLNRRGRGQPTDLLNHKDRKTRRSKELPVQLIALRLCVRSLVLPLGVFNHRGHRDHGGDWLQLL